MLDFGELKVSLLDEIGHSQKPCPKPKHFDQQSVCVCVCVCVRVCA